MTHPLTLQKPHRMAETRGLRAGRLAPSQALQHAGFIPSSCLSFPTPQGITGLRGESLGPGSPEARTSIRHRPTPTPFEAFVVPGGPLLSLAAPAQGVCGTRRHGMLSPAFTGA